MGCTKTDSPRSRGELYVDTADNQKREVSDLDSRSLTAIGNFFSNLFNKRDGTLDSRSFQAIGNIFHSIFGYVCTFIVINGVYWMY